ncbi:MAG: hypothetical protein Q8R44_14825 [Novosphingobium sp.]|nr:hypothetical protein [Novosphingobium sp.]
MKLPPWLRILWWLLLTGAGIAFLALRRSSLLAGAPSTFDLAVFVITGGLVLAPLFSEVTLWGVTLKQLEKASDEIKRELTSLRLQVTTAVQASSSVSQQFHLGTPPPDSALPALEARIQEVVRRELDSTRPPTEVLPAPSAPPAMVDALFRIRYDLDREIRRIATGRQLGRAPGFDGHQSTIALARLLESDGILPEALADGIREVYSVCSRAIHAEPVTDRQVAFAKLIGSQILLALPRLA